MPKIVFCGYGKLGHDCLDMLVQEGYNICFVLTHKDLSENSVDLYAREKDIPFFYNDLRKDDNIVNIQEVSQDSQLVSINYRFILPKDFFSRFKYALNIHGSLLPKYRGRTPQVWSIINGEKYSGISCHLIDEGIDTGAIIKQEEIEIVKKDTGYTLLKKYESRYPKLLKESLELLKNGIKPTPQNHNEATFFGKREAIMGYINFYDKAVNVINFIRAQAGLYPGAYCYLSNGKKFIIDEIQIDKSSAIKLNNIGVPVLFDNIYYVKCIDTKLRVVKYRL